MNKISVPVMEFFLFLYFISSVQTKAFISKNFYFIGSHETL